MRASTLLKTLDRTVGVAVVRLLGFAPKRRDTGARQNIGLLRSAAIGDTLLLAGVLKDTVAAFPTAQVTLVTGEDNAPAGALVIPEGVRHVVVSVGSPLTALATIRSQRFDVLIDTGQWPRFDAVLTALSGARFRVGFATSGQQRHYAYDLVVPHSSDEHESENFRALARAIGVNTDSTPAIDRRRLPKIGVPSRPFAVFHPWSGGFRGELKQWPAERWVELAGRLRGVTDSVVVTGSTAQAGISRSLAASITAAGIRAEARCDLSLAQCGALLCESSVVVSVNTGVMHLAAQLGVPTVSLEGPTPVRRWGPIGPKVRSVSTTLPGCGFLNLGFEYDGHRSDCMLGVSVDAVEVAIREIAGR